MIPLLERQSFGSDLYIAKYHSFHADVYTVVDTKTGKEYVLNRDNVRFYVSQGRRVHGVDKHGNISVYQPEDTITPLQIKTSALLGVDIKVYKSEIVEIKFKYYPKRISRIRLSDFGVGIDKYAMTQMMVSNRVYAVFIVDDKLKFEPESFCGGEYLTIRDLGAMLDITELSDELAEPLYRHMASKPELGTVLQGNLIDRQERMAYYSILLTGG